MVRQSLAAICRPLPYQLVTVALLSTMLLGTGLRSQTLPSDSREGVLQEIKAYAARHVQASAPMQTDVVIRAFSGNRVGLTSDEIGRIYEEEYLRLKLAQKPNTWRKITQNQPLIVVIVLFFAGVVALALKDWLATLIKSLLNLVYAGIAGRRLVQGFALRRYRRALREKCARVNVPFRPNRPLDLRAVYVPLKVSGNGNRNPVDAMSVIADFPRVVIVGPPGAGKSMLLKQMALGYAEGRAPDLWGEHTPVLLDLHRMNDSKMSLEQHLVAEFARNDFPHAEKFVSRGLRSGTLTLLLDGLDEVSSNERQNAAANITDLLDQHRDCRLVVTCRSAVYRDELAQHTQQKREIVDFNDQQIRLFLRAFEPDMPPERSAEHLMGTLRDRPRIKALARNPLLLTIIAFLYTDTEFVLPHSRAEFYKQATDFLLAQLHPERNSFEARAKRLVLQHLGLFNQDRASKLGQDQRTMHYAVVLGQLRKILPDLNLDPTRDSIPLLNEVVERSGLLLSIDGGENYQFTHLTLQEYFAAARLIGDPIGLLKRFTSDRDAWREVVKLWCGLDVDSSDLLREIYASDPITALECLADSQKVDPTLATRIQDENKKLLGAHERQEEVALAFAGVASDLRPRGAAAFSFLENTLLTDQDPARRATAANALSLTNLPQAARVLARMYPERHEFVRTHLARMGDVAVRELSELAQSGPLEVLEDLKNIGTPQAAETILPLIWNADEHRARRAAWCLASLLSIGDVEDALRSYHLTDGQKGEKSFEWVWQPFDEPSDSALPAIAGRLAYLITEDLDLSPPEVQWTFDPRVAIPVLCVMPEAGPITRRLKEIFDDLKSRRLSELSLQEENELRRRVRSAATTKRWLWLFSGLPPATRDELSVRLGEGLQPTAADWRGLYHPLEYEFHRSWYFRSVLAIVGTLSVGAIREVGLVLVSSRMALAHGRLIQLAALLALPVLVFVCIAAIFELFASLVGKSLAEDPQELGALAGVFRLASTIVNLRNQGLRGKRRVWSAFSSISVMDSIWVIVIGVPALLFFSTWGLLRFLRPRSVWILDPSLIVFCVVAWARGLHLDRAARNPLHGILEGKQY